MSSFFRSAWMKAAVAGVAVAGVSFGALAAAGAATSLPAGTIHGCVYLHSNRTLEGVYTDPAKGTTCPAGTFQVVWGVQGPAGPQGPQGPAGPAGPPGQNAILTVSAQTQVSNWPESGGWANDAYTRDVTITRQHASPAADCGASATQCWFYTETLGDNGSFTTVDGHASPNGSSPAAIAGSFTGTMTGGGKLEFYASSDSPNPALVPGTADGSAKPSSTTDWYHLFFPDGTLFGAATGANAPWVTYDWSYAANVTNVVNNSTITCTQTWNDGINPGDDGQGSGDGNITGTCPTS